MMEGVAGKSEESSYVRSWWQPAGGGSGYRGPCGS